MIDLISQQKEEDNHLSLSCMCKSLSISRATFYRNRFNSYPLDEDIDLRHQIQLIALDMPCYGYRRITKELARRGCLVNHKCVLRLMREDNLLCLRKKLFVATTDSAHNLAIYPNLARDMVLDGINQLWVSDITYVRLQREFVYLAVVLDVFSRRCIGWSLGRRLDGALTIVALDMAFESRRITPGLVHHSDRGVQYASKDYIARLKNNGITISMSRRGNPYDNAYAESFMKTLKYEEVYLWEYENFDEALMRIDFFIDDIYNNKRLHSAIGYLPPAEYEEALALAAAPHTP
jgi:putative transposase